MIVVSGNNSTIVNETEYTIVLESGTSGNKITSCGTVIDNGNNTVVLNNCTFDLGTPTCINTPSLIEAECFDSQFGIEKEDCNEGGLNIGYIHNEDYAIYNTIDLSNQNSFKVRYATKNSGGSIEVRTDARDGNLIGHINIPVTGGWQNWQTDSVNIQAVSGEHNIYLVFKGGVSYLYNINWFGFSQESILVTGTSNTSENVFSIYPNPTSGLVQFSSVVEYVLSDIMGNKIKSGVDNKTDISNFLNGMYILEIKTNDQILQYKIMKE